MRLCEIWIGQCDAARQIEAEFRTQNTLDYLIGENLGEDDLLSTVSSEACPRS